MSHSYRVRIGMREVAAMQPDTVLWDLEVRGFCARKQRSDIVTYSVIYRTKEGQQRWFKLGHHGSGRPHKRATRLVKYGSLPITEKTHRRSAMRYGAAQPCRS